MEVDSAELLTILGEHLVNSVIGREPFETVKEIVDQGAPLWYQNEEEGLSALHAAAYIQDADLAKYLIEEGAVWNALDNYGNSAGDIALSFGDEQTYTTIRDAGIRSEMLLSLLGRKHSDADGMVLRTDDKTAAASTGKFLQQKLVFKKDQHGQEICLVDAGNGQEVGVMMAWETPIMEETVRLLCPSGSLEGMKVLNVGFGLGIIDSLFQSLPTRPEQHIIIEAHPDVLQHMRELGWYEKPGVKILEGKWQDFVDSEELLSTGGFDVIYTDTFSEDYKTLYEFFEHLPDLLSGPEARFGFFNGLGATNLLFYDVATLMSELHLSEVGINVEWTDVDVTQDSKNRWGHTREYFSMPVYRLPVGTMSIM